MRWRGDDRIDSRLGLAALSFVVSFGQASHDTTAVVTVPLHQTEGHASSPPSVSVSGDGRFVAFASAAALVPEDTNDRDDIYVLDRESGLVTLESGDGTPAMGHRPALSGTGRYLVYENVMQVLVFRDRVSGAVRPLQRGREPPNGSSRDVSISADGRYVAFASGATNLTDGPDDNGAAEDIYVADTTSMSFRRVAVSSFAPAISADGRVIAFCSTAIADAAAAGSKSRTINTYVVDQQTGVTTRVSVSASGAPPDGSSYAPALSADGRYVAFVSEAANLLRRHDHNKVPDVFVRDMVAKVTDLVSRTPSGESGNGPSRHPAISADGNVVVFQSDASNLTCGDRCATADRDINLVADIFRRDRRSGITELVSRGRTPWMEPSIGPAIDRTGRIVAFSSRHPLDQADDRHDYDLFVWTRELRH